MLPFLQACEPAGSQVPLILCVVAAVFGGIAAFCGIAGHQTWSLCAQRFLEAVRKVFSAVAACATWCKCATRASRPLLRVLHVPSIRATRSPVHGRPALFYKDCGELGVHLRLALAALLLLVAGIVWLNANPMDPTTPSSTNPSESSLMPSASRIVFSPGPLIQRHPAS